MLGRLKQLHNRGDTIVEVMIVLAILGLAIGISYATANRSLLNARQAQENSQASNLAQSQVEALRTLVDDPGQNIFQAGPYCLSQTAPYTIQTGSSCNFGTIPYHIDITCANNPCSASGDTFTVKITWDDVIEAGQKDTLSIVYRLYAPTTGVFQQQQQQNCTPPQIGIPPNCTNPPAFSAKLANTSCVKATSTQGNYSSDVSFTGTPGDNISLFVANGLKRYNQDNASFTIGSDGTYTGSISGIYDIGSTWSAFVNDTTHPTSQAQLRLCP